MRAVAEHFFTDEEYLHMEEVLPIKHEHSKGRTAVTRNQQFEIMGQALCAVKTNG